MKSRERKSPMDMNARFERFYRDWLHDYARINGLSPERVHESIRGCSTHVSSEPHMLVSSRHE